MSASLVRPDAERGAEIDADYGLTEEEQASVEKFSASLNHRGAQPGVH